MVDILARGTPQIGRCYLDPYHCFRALSVEGLEAGGGV